MCILKCEIETCHLLPLFARLFTHSFEFMHSFNSIHFISIQDWLWTISKTSMHEWQILKCNFELRCYVVAKCGFNLHSMKQMMLLTNVKSRKKFFSIWIFFFNFIDCAKSTKTFFSCFNLERNSHMFFFSFSIRTMNCVLDSKPALLRLNNNHLMVFITPDKQTEEKLKKKMGISTSRFDTFIIYMSTH